MRAALSAVIMAALLLTGASPAFADVDPVARGLAAKALGYIPNSLTGNQLVNFGNVALQHSAGAAVASGGHKSIFYVGNSTVWNPTSYYSEWCNALAVANVLTATGLTACTTTITSYTVNNTTGSITVNFTGSAPSGYAVGDLILSQPSNNTLAALEGTGVITSIGASSFTYQMLAINTFPSSTGTTSSGGYVTNSLLNLGFNGATSLAINTTVTPLLAQYVLPGDLVMVRGDLINDVRLGACNLACATPRVQAQYSSTAAAIPATADIAWKTENSLLTTDPTSSGLVSPLGSSQAYSNILHDAVFQGLGAIKGSRAVVWDTQQIVYSKLSAAYATSAFMSDILHPAGAGQSREAASDAQIIASVIAGRGFPVVASLNDPYSNQGSNSAVLNGQKAWIDNLRQAVGFSPFLADHAFMDNYASPWTAYSDAVLDPNRFDVVAWGTVTQFSSTSLSISQPTLSGATLKEVQANDLIWQMGSGVTAIPPTFSQSARNNGGTVFDYQLSNLGSTAAATYTGQPAVIVRRRTQNLADLPYFNDPATYPYHHQININAAGTNFLRFHFTDGAATWPNSVTASDTLTLPCGIVSLSGASFTLQSAGVVQINLTGAWAACALQNGYVFGTHNTEGTFGFLQYAGALDSAYATATPTTGTTVTMAETTSREVITPAGTLAALTIQLPTCSTNYDGKEAMFTSSQAITALTVTATAGTIGNAGTALTAGIGERYVCVGATAVWNRIF